MPEFADIIGQDEAIRRIQRAMAAARMPHAYIFTGPAGVGRRTTAVALAKTMLCAESVTEKRGEASFRQACCRCEDCKMVAAGSHPDFHLVYKELARYHDSPQVRSRVMQDLGIDVIRSFLIGPAGRASSRRRGKVFVVLEAELMSVAAQNAMLKTLEEPPAGVTIILVCRQGEQLLPTTLSRCSMVRFGPLPRHFVAETLADEGIAEPEAAFWSKFTDGSIGTSVRLAAQGMYAIKKDVLERIAGLAGDGEVGEFLAGQTDKLAETAVRAAKKENGVVLSKMLASRRASGIVLELIGSAYRDALRLAAGDAPCDNLVNADQLPVVQTMAGRFSPAQLAEIIEQLSEYEQLLWRNVNPKIVWDNVAITCRSALPLGL